MTKQQIFPAILMLLDLGAGIVYLMGGDIKRAIYWWAALVLTACVTF